MTTQLTEREQRVISLAAEGLTRDEIGEQLSISVNGVGKHLDSIYCKLGARNVTHAVVLAIRAATTSSST